MIITIIFIPLLSLALIFRITVGSKFEKLAVVLVQDVVVMLSHLTVAI